MESVATVREKVNETIEALPPQGLEELSRFVDALAKKYQAEQEIVALGGLWDKTPFDVEDAEVRDLRRHLADGRSGKLE